MACVHAETSTGVLNPVRDLAAVAHEHGALILVDAVAWLGGHPLDTAAWGLDAVYSCTQKCIGAPSGLAPIAWTPAAQARRVAMPQLLSRSSAGRGLLGAPQVPPHAVVDARLRAARGTRRGDDEEGLEARWSRHERNHLALVHGLKAMGLELLPPPAGAAVDLECRARPQRRGRSGGAPRRCWREFSIEIGAGLGPLAGKIWRVGLMGASSRQTRLVTLFLGALEHILHGMGHKSPGGAAAAAMDALGEAVAAS